MKSYHDRFAAALAAALPEGFEVYADAHAVAVHYGTASLFGFPPRVEDKRKPVRPDDVSDWIDRHTSRLRSQMRHYTPQAKGAARALLAALEPQEVARMKVYAAVIEWPADIADRAPGLILARSMKERAAGIVAEIRKVADLLTDPQWREALAGVDGTTWDDCTEALENTRYGSPFITIYEREV